MQGALTGSPQTLPVMAALATGLERVEKIFDAHLESDLPAVYDLVRHVERYRGKMLRPTLTLLMGLAAHPRIERTPPGDLAGLWTLDHATCGAVCEMVHMATLVHDDVLDEADTRRRGTTVNRLRGNEAAVMLGDYLIAGAYALCASMQSVEPSRLVGKASMRMCAGELLQLDRREDFSLDESAYFEVISRKTAAIISAAAELGAWASGASAEVRGAAAQFGEHVGVAFQIQDDILDLTGTEEGTGKSVGKDAEKGKLTLPVIHHLACADSRQRGRSLLMLEAAASGSGRSELAWELRQALERTGSLAYAVGVARGRVEQAKAALRALPLSPPRVLLEEYANAAVDRSF